MNIKEMKRFILSFEDAWNCPNEILETITGFSWMQYHKLRIEIAGEEE